MKVAEAMDSKPKIFTSTTALSMSACAALTRSIAKMMMVVTEQKRSTNVPCSNASACLLSLPRKVTRKDDTQNNDIQSSPLACVMMRSTTYISDRNTPVIVYDNKSPHRKVLARAPGPWTSKAVDWHVHPHPGSEFIIARVHYLFDPGRADPTACVLGSRRVRRDGAGRTGQRGAAHGTGGSAQRVRARPRAARARVLRPVSSRDGTDPSAPTGSGGGLCTCIK